MSIFHLAGDPRVLLTHAALYGLTSILEDAGVEDLTIWWNDGAAQLESPGLTGEMVDEAVRDHAAAQTRDESWVAQSRSIDGSVRGLMSPRLSVFKSDDTWKFVQDERHAVLDRLTHAQAWFDLRMIAALGEPCYWRRDRKGDLRQADGASRWEMQPRNRGSEIVTNRLRPLAEFVAKRSVGQVAAGLNGTRPVDELGRDTPGSSTATGLRMPSPTDNALAWCALWGIASLPGAPRTNSPVASSGHLGRAGGEWFCAPVWVGPWRPARLRTVLASNQLTTATSDGVASSPGLPAVRSAASWLAARGVAGLVRFPIERFGSEQTEARRAMYGEPVSLGVVL